MQGTRVRALVWEDPTCRGVTKPGRHNYGSPRTLGPTCCNYWDRVLQLLKPARLGPMFRDKRSHLNEKAVHSNEDPMWPQNKLILKNGQRIWIAIFPKRHPDGQLLHEKVFNITNYQENPNQNYKISRHTCYDGYYQKDKKGFPGGAVVKNPPANAGEMGSSPGLGRSHMSRSN